MTPPEPALGPGAAVKRTLGSSHAAAPLLQAIAADAPVHDRDATLPLVSLARLRDAGLLALTVPRALGGEGAGLAKSFGLVRAVGAACPATALILAMQLLKQAAVAREPAWPSALRERIGRAAVAEGALMNAARAEPELGSPTRGGLPATVARRTGTGWALTGRKRYVTGGEALRFIEVYARTDEERPRIGSFLVAAGTPGLRFEAAWNHLGLRGSGSHDLVLQDVPVPEAHAVGLLSAYTPRPPSAEQAAWSSLLVGAVYLGVAEAARDWILRFLRERRPSDRDEPLSALPTVREAVGAIEARLLAARRIGQSLAAEVDAGSAPPAWEGGLAKALLARNAIEAVERAVALAGNHALDRAHALERHWRDVQCARVHVPTEDAAHDAAGRAAFAREISA